jgi:hypothetical protein
MLELVTMFFIENGFTLEWRETAENHKKIIAFGIVLSPLK